jgi:hypothetical protein
MGAPIPFDLANVGESFGSTVVTQSVFAGDRIILASWLTAPAVGVISGGPTTIDVNAGFNII